MGRIVSGQETTKASGIVRRLGGTGRLLESFGASADSPTSLTPQELYLSPRIAASINAVIAALRWGTVMLGLVFAAPQVGQEEGGLRVVVTVAVAIFLTSWRTISPLKLGHLSPYTIGLALADVAILSLAVSLHNGFANPMVGTLYMAIAVVGFGWGLPLGVGSAALAVVTITAGRLLGPDLAGSTVDLALVAQLFPNTGAVTTLAGVAIMPGVALNRLLEYEGRRKLLVDQRDKLAQTNELLATLNDLARTLPSSLDLADVVQNTRKELMDSFDASRMALLSLEDGIWSPVVQDGFGLPPELPTNELPTVFQRALHSTEVIQNRRLVERNRSPRVRPLYTPRHP